MRCKTQSTPATSGSVTGYARTRREDPRIVERVHAALGEARTVVNVGAGAGSYEPGDRHVIAIEPSDVIADQRPADHAPAIRASAGRLPLRDDSVDVAMAMVTDWLGEGTRVETVPLARDTPDWMCEAFWAHPERVFDPVARAATSSFARMESAVVERVLRELRRDLDSGAWDTRHGELRTLDTYDVGLRLVINP